MAQQIINTSAAANDGTGEPLRDAFTAVNENFTEIYTAGPVGSNVVISGNTVTVTGVNNNLVLQANGIGNIQANSTIMPSIDAVYDIGAPTKRIDTVYAQYLVGNGSGITGVTAAAAANISLGFSNVTVTAAGPVTVGIQNVGNTAVFAAASTTFKGNLLPAANITYDLGSASQAWNDLYLSGNTVYLNNATITSNATALVFTNQAGGSFVLADTGQSGTNAISNGNSNVSIAAAASNVVIAVNGLSRGTFSTGGLDIIGAVNTVGNVVATGNVTAAYLFGNGSQLTGLPATYGNANVVANLAALGSNPVSTTGNITGGNILGGANVNATTHTGTTVSVTANVVGGNITTGGQVSATANITGGNITTGGLISATGNVTGGNITTAGLTSTASLSVTGNTATITTANYSIGYLNIPQISLEANTTTALTDSGKHYYSVSASNLALTIANNTSVSWPIGTAISIVNRGTANIIIAGGTGVSVYLAGNSSAGNRFVTTYGMATVINVAANIWMINGTVS